MLARNAAITIIGRNMVSAKKPANGQQGAVDVDHGRAEREQDHRNEMGSQNGVTLPQQIEHRPACNQQQDQRHHDMGIGAFKEHHELLALAPRPVFGGKIGTHGVKTQRHYHSDQIDRCDNDQIFAQQLRPPHAGNQRLDQKDQTGTAQTGTEDDRRLRRKPPVNAHCAASLRSARTWVGLVLGLRQPSITRRI